ncbi:hypothetical protein B9Z19DRAFT_463155 [Tuber borchii]|uniref:Uncharacterized protein n=1 Tax=Tuber borchii TaxID=42251 RepID=A0A2T6ZFQ2_TUBBO|nr:hypothetical protein B9Z19DRAFT_463155 [Tuber borchii]
MSSFASSKLANLYGPSLLAAIIPSATVIWATMHGNAELEKKMMDEMQGVRQDVNGVRQDVNDVKEAVVVSGRHIMSAIDGDKAPMRQWLASIEQCRQFGGCNGL